ncbi:hypothetical protein [Hymenobacter sp. B81]|uniref:hypothetical protein n=1 Tax=Hymenobacter sp. B81 TaxID=3344878 RepID=UPI0037DCEE78
MFLRSRLFPGGLLMLLLSSCAQAPDSRATVEATAVASAIAELPLDAARSSRRSLADTLSLPYGELAKFLPETVGQFVRDGVPQGESVNIGGVSYSTCEQYYRCGKQRLKVQLVDYNGANALYAGATAMMAAGFSQENDEHLMRGCDLGIPNVQGYETLQKKERRASVALGVGDRFFVSVELDQQHNTDLVRDVAKTMDLQTLAKL